MARFTGYKGILHFQAEGNTVSLEVQGVKLPEGDEDMALKIAQDIVRSLRLPTREADHKEAELKAKLDKVTAQLHDVQQLLENATKKPEEAAKAPEPVKVHEVEEEDKPRRGRR